MKMLLTKAAIIAAEPGTYYDSKQPGLCVYVTPTSRKYGVYVSIRSVPTRRSLGNVADKSVEAARMEAARIITELRETPKQKQKKMTVGGLLSLYNEYLEIQGSKDSSYVDRATNLYWSHLLTRNLSDVSVLEVTQHHNKLSKQRGPSAARYAITVLRALYSYASSLDLTNANPAKFVKTAQCNSRDVYLDEGEVELMRECLKEMASTPRHYLLLVLLTGARRENMATMEWSEVDLDAALWTIPASKSKNGDKMEVPLVPEAVEILRGRKSLDPKFVFPSGYRPNQPVSNVYEWVLELRRLLNAKGCPKAITIHDLRRTFASRLVYVGVPTPVIAKALGHRSLSSVGIYARASTSMVREALSRV